MLASVPAYNNMATEMEFKRLGHRWGQTFHAYLSDPSISVGAKALYALMASYANTSTGECKPTQQRLADELGCTVRAVQKWQKELRDHGVLVTLTQATSKGKSNTYGLPDPGHRVVASEGVTNPGSGGGDEPTFGMGAEPTFAPTQQLQQHRESSLRSDSPAAPAGAEAGVAKVEAPKHTAGDLVASWVDGYRSGFGHDPDPELLKKAAGRCAQAAKSRRNEADWERALGFAFEAGEQGLFDISQAIPTKRVSQFVSAKMAEEKAIYGTGETPEEREARWARQAEELRARQAEDQRIREENDRIWAERQEPVLTAEQVAERAEELRRLVREARAGA